MRYNYNTLGNSYDSEYQSIQVYNPSSTDYRKAIVSIVKDMNIQGEPTKDEQALIISLANLKRKIILDEGLKKYNQVIEETDDRNRVKSILVWSAFAVLTALFFGLWFVQSVTLIAMGFLYIILGITIISSDIANPENYPMVIYKINEAMGYSGVEANKFTKFDDRAYDELMSCYPELMDIANQVIGEDIDTIRTNIREKQYRELLVQLVGQEKAEEYFHLFV